MGLKEGQFGQFVGGALEKFKRPGPITAVGMDELKQVLNLHNAREITAKVGNEFYFDSNGAKWLRYPVSVIVPKDANDSNRKLLGVNLSEPESIFFSSTGVEALFNGTYPTMMQVQWESFATAVLIAKHLSEVNPELKIKIQDMKYIYHRSREDLPNMLDQLKEDGFEPYKLRS
jgi:hypothetical protein